VWLTGKILPIAFKQFFDHYCKEYGAPIWMTRGIPARMKGIEDGFAIDKQISTPSIGALLNDTEYKKRFGDRPRDLSISQDAAAYAVRFA